MYYGETICTHSVLNYIIQSSLRCCTGTKPFISSPTPVSNAKNDKNDTKKNGIADIVNESNSSHLNQINKLQSTNINEKESILLLLKKNQREFDEKYNKLNNKYETLQSENEPLK